MKTFSPALKRSKICVRLRNNEISVSEYVRRLFWSLFWKMVQTLRVDHQPENFWLLFFANGFKNGFVFTTRDVFTIFTILYANNQSKKKVVALSWLFFSIFLRQLKDLFYSKTCKKSQTQKLKNGIITKNLQLFLAGFFVVFYRKRKLLPKVEWENRLREEEEMKREISQKNWGK